MNKEKLLNCHQRIKPYIYNTPILSSQLINNICETEIYFKCENFQKMGAFKMRGATNAIKKNCPGTKKIKKVDKKAEKLKIPLFFYLK